MNMKKFMQAGALSLAMLATSLATPAEVNGCTGLQLAAQNGASVNGRTLEFGIYIDAAVVVVPRGYAFTGTTTQGPGLSYKTKYATVGFIAFNNLSVMDGMNEKGLSVGTFYFPGFAGYSQITSENQSKAVSQFEFSNWLLTQFASVSEIKAALPNIAIAPVVIKSWGATPSPFHYIVYDKNGESLVIEPINGKLVTYDNPIGTFTNSPTFDWHLTNLRNYINLSAINAKPLKIDGLTLTSFGQGSGLVGMPGDFTPPSRFVRASIFSFTAIPSKTTEEAVYQLFHILNQFDIPVGTVRAVENGVTYTDMTLVTAVRDPQALKYYFRTFEDSTIRVVDLKRFDLDAKVVKKLDPSIFKQFAVDISKDLK